MGAMTPALLLCGAAEVPAVASRFAAVLLFAPLPLAPALPACARWICAAFALLTAGFVCSLADCLGIALAAVALQGVLPSLGSLVSMAQSFELVMPEEAPEELLVDCALQAHARATMGQAFNTCVLTIPRCLLI